MGDVNTALAASREAIEEMILTGERCGPAWIAPRAPGKWSPSQIAEHVARSLEESANMAAGRQSKFPSLPALVHPIVRGLPFKRVLRKGAFPKAKTNKAMNPASGPTTASEGRVRLEEAHRKFEETCRQIASGDRRLRTTIFGAVPVSDYVRFAELHTRHHGKQMADVAGPSISMAYDEQLANRIRRVLTIGESSPNEECSEGSPFSTRAECAAASWEAI